MKNIFIVVLLTIVTCGYSQDGAPCSKGSRIPTPKKKFVADSESNNLRLYVLGGIAAAVTTKDIDFAKKSGFLYHDFGCLAPVDRSFYVTYNTLVLKYLDAKLEKGWQKEIIASTIGFNEFKNKE